MTTSTSPRVPASPAARRRAALLGVVLTQVIPAGHGIRVADVDRYAARPDRSPVAPLVAPLVSVVEVDVTGIADVVAAVRSAVDLPVIDLGSHGAVYATSTLASGTPAVLGVGAPVRRPVIVHIDDGHEGIGIRSIAHLVLTHDVHVVDADAAGLYLFDVKRRLETESRATLP